MLLLRKKISPFVFACFAFILSSNYGFGQLTATFTKTINTICDGSDCDYSGPSVLINEMMMSPSSNDGSLWGPSCSGQCGEWIELYNPNLCEPVDVSCYYLGNNAPDGGGFFPTDYPGGFTIPPGTIIPAGGFLLLRGSNTDPIDPNLLIANGGNSLEIVVDATNSCIGSGTRLWFPNAGSWFAFYDQNGVPQDAVSWGPNSNNITNANKYPCVTPVSTCSFSGTLPNYDEIPATHKNFIYQGAIPNGWGQSLRRFPDGGAWQTNQGTPAASITAGYCNDVCATLGSSSCDGTATVNPVGGTGPYTYLWNDSQMQMTQTATGLCEGTYQVTVTDANSVTGVFSVEITNFVPTVTLAIQDEICVNSPAFTITGALPVPGPGQLGVYSGAGVSNGSFDPAVAGEGMHVITYVFTDENACINDVTGIDSIKVNPLPTPTITNFDSEYCVSAAAITPTLTPTGGTLSGTGVTGGQFSPNTAGVGTHTLTYSYTDGNGCSNTTTEQILINPLPVVSITGVASSYCLSETPISLTFSPAGGTLSGPGVVNNEFVPSVAGIGNHTITYTATDANSCENSTTAVINVVASPAPTFVIQPTICDYQGAIPLAGSPAGGVFTLNGNTITEFNPATAGAGTHTIIYAYTDVNTCIGNASASIDVIPRPTLSSSLLPAYCYESQNVTLTFSPTGGVATGDLLTGNTLNIANANPGSYGLEYVYSDANGCENTLNQTFVVTSPIYPKFTSSTDCFQNQSFINLTTPAGNYQYQWSAVNGGSSTASNPSIYFPVFGDHQVALTVTDSYNCVYDTVQAIYVEEGVSPGAFEIPNVITPNDDGVNDYLELSALMETCLDYKILILNRWGNVVYEMEGNNNAFSGKDLSGKDLADGVYFYMVVSDMIDCKSPDYKGFCSGIIHIVR